MKNLKKGICLFVSVCLMASLMVFPAFASSKDDEEDEKDYVVTDVSFDVSDSNVKIYWTTGDSKTSYSVQLYDGYSSKDSSGFPVFKSSNKVGEAITGSYNSAQVDVTNRVIKNGSGTYYAVVTCKKKYVNGTYEHKNSNGYSDAYAYEYIDSDAVASLKKKYSGSTSDSGTTSSSSSANTTNSNGPGVSASGSWKQNTDSTWSYYENNTAVKSGWRAYNAKWYYLNENGIMETNKWIQSADTSNGIWYYVGTDGAMLTNTTFTDSTGAQYTVNTAGEWHS